MKLVITSDTHGLVKLEDVPDGDVFIHAGDFTKRGHIQEVEAFFNEVGSLWHPYKVVVAGNHDFACEGMQALVTSMARERYITYLHHEPVEIDGIKFFGSPYTPRFGTWAFMREPDEMQYLWKQIPPNTNVLITHGPAHGILDTVPCYPDPLHVGCEQLAERLPTFKNLKAHICGHIHESRGMFVNNSNTAFINASAVDIRMQKYPEIFFEHEIDAI